MCIYNIYIYMERERERGGLMEYIYPKKLQFAAYVLVIVNTTLHGP